MSDPIIKTIGTILKGKPERDAIHVAILPAKADEPLVQGTTVTVDENGLARHARRELAIGIVDPFLPNAVDVGQKFWVFIFPGTVTGMRHHFELPAIDGAARSEAEVRSREWLAQYASDCKWDYKEMIEAVTDYVNDGSMLEDNFNSYEVPDEFWTHFKTVTGLQGEGHFWTCCPG